MPMYWSEEVKQKMSKTRLGVKKTEETKQRMKEAWARRKALKAKTVNVNI